MILSICVKFDDLSQTARGYIACLQALYLRHLTESSITTTEIYQFPLARNTVNKTVSELFFYRCVYACICMCTYFTIFLFTGLIPV